MTTPPPSGRPPAPAGAPGDARHRRRRRHGRGGGGPADAPGPSRAKPAPLVPEVSHIADAPTDTLAPAEVAEMKEHVAFIRRYREALRLKLNSAEDLLVNGQREPSERGVCRHLLAKVDRVAIEAAIAREPLRSDAAGRAHMLAGAVRVIADVGVLLAYLEALAQVRSHAEAAEAFAEVVRRIDFESLSQTRLVRLLQVLTQTFADHERVQVLFSLLTIPGFRRAFDAAEPHLPPDVAGVFAPLRAVHRRALEGGAGPATPALLAQGMEQLLAAPDPVLRGYAEPLRVGILELALGADVPAAVADRATGVLLASLPRTGRVYTRLATRRAAQLLARHVDDRARALLEELRRAQPELATAQRWLAALGAHRIGRVALTGDAPGRGRLRPGFWLDGQRAVWLRTAVAPDAERVAAEAKLQAGLGLPGVAAVVERGVASGIPYVAMVGAGEVLTLSRPLDAPTALSLAAEAARILHALALAGVMLPDAEPERFLLGPSLGATLGHGLLLADLDGARAGEPGTVAGAHAALAVAWARRILPEDTTARAGSETGEALRVALAGQTSMAELVGILDRAALRTSRD